MNNPIEHRLALYHLGLTDRQIAKATKSLPNTILQWRRSRNLPPNAASAKARRQAETWKKRRAALAAKGAFT